MRKLTDFNLKTLKHRLLLLQPEHFLDFHKDQILLLPETSTSKTSKSLLQYKCSKAAQHVCIVSEHSEMNLRIIGHMTKKLLKFEGLFWIKNYFLITWTK